MDALHVPGTSRALAAVHADDREAGARPVQPRLRPRRERDRLGQGTSAVSGASPRAAGAAEDELS